MKHAYPCRYDDGIASGVNPETDRCTCAPKILRKPKHVQQIRAMLAHATVVNSPEYQDVLAVLAEMLAREESRKVYVVLLGYYDCEGGGDSLKGIFDTFDKAEAFVLGNIAKSKEEAGDIFWTWNELTIRISIDEWDNGGDQYSGNSYCRIEEHEVL